MNSIEYIPLDMNDSIGGSKKLISLLTNKRILIGVVILLIVVLLLSKKKSGSSTVKSTTTSNTVSIHKKIEANGEVKLVKKVNGEEVELTEEDMQTIKDAEAKAQTITNETKKNAQILKSN